MCTVVRSRRAAIAAGSWITNILSNGPLHTQTSMNYTKWLVVVWTIVICDGKTALFGAFPKITEIRDYTPPPSPPLLPPPSSSSSIVLTYNKKKHKHGYLLAVDSANKLTKNPKLCSLTCSAIMRHYESDVALFILDECCCYFSVLFLLFLSVLFSRVCVCVGGWRRG